jgi:DNA-directed RNA polymerase specialized sigma24 family protein
MHDGQSVNFVLPEPATDCSWSEATDPGLIAALRLLARSYRRDSLVAADHLVELTLETAIKEIDRRPEGISLYQWLSGIMARRHN